MSVLTYTFGDMLTNSTTETWMAEFVPDFTDVDAQAFSMVLALTATTPNTRDAVVSVRIGGASGVADGYLVGQATIPAGTNSASITVPRVVLRGNTTPIKMTMRSTTVGDVSFATSVFTLTTIDSVPSLTPNRVKAENDIWLGPKGENGTPEYDVTVSGDWRLVSGREALEQSLIRRFTTILRSAVKQSGRKSDHDDMAAKLKEAAMRDERVSSVPKSVVTIEGNKTVFDVAVIPKQDTKRVVTVSGTLGG